MIFFGNVLCIAQDQEIHLIDSLKAVNRLETDQEKHVLNLNKIAYLFGEHYIDSSLVYLDSSILLANTIAYKEGAAEAYFYKAKALIQTGILIEAIENYNKSLALYTELKDSASILYNYRGLSYAYSFGTNQLQGLDYNLKALALAEELKDSASLSIAFNNIAVNYKNLDNYEMALFYFEKSLELDLKQDDKDNSAITYSNMGVLKVEHQKLEEAKTDYYIVQSLIPDIKNPYIKSYLFISLAGYYIATEKYDSAKHYLSLADTICEENNYPHILVRAYRRRGEMFFKQKKFRESIVYFDKCLELSESINVYEEFPKIYKLKAQAYSQLGNFKEAYDNSEQADRFLDSAKTKSIAIALAEFDKEQKVKLEKELISQQTENVQLQLRFKYRLALISSILLLISGLLFIYLFLRIRNKNATLRKQHDLINQQKNIIEDNFEKLQLNEKKLHKLNASKDKFFSIIAHDLRSPFNAILGFSNELISSYDDYNNDQRKEMISVISASSESTLFLLENLLNWARAQSDSIKIRKEVHNLKFLVDESITPYLGSAEFKSVLVQNTIPEDLEIRADKETIKVVFSNLFSNAVKFSSNKSEIKISAKLKKNAVEICIADSGIGMSKKILNDLFTIETNTQRSGTLNEKGTGLGLILCEEFVLLNNGTIWAESAVGKGSSFYITLPLANNQ